MEPESALNVRNAMNKKDIKRAVEPEKKDASSSIAQGEAVEPEAARVLAGKIQDVRKAALGSLVTAAASLGFNKNTIDSYEREKTLPDIDFLVVFADKTGADLNELLRLRLQASRYPTVRALAHGFMLRAAPEEARLPELDTQLADIEAALGAVEETAFPLSEEAVAQRPDLLDIKARLEAISLGDDASPSQRARANIHLRYFFGDKGAAARQQRHEDKLFGRVRRATEALMRLRDELGYEAPMIWTGLAQELMFAHGLTEDGAKRLLETVRTYTNP